MELFLQILHGFRLIIFILSVVHLVMQMEMETSTLLLPAENLTTIILNSSGFIITPEICWKHCLPGKVILLFSVMMLTGSIWTWMVILILFLRMKAPQITYF